ncbi:MAG: hypothetical protein IT520_05495 [Burkholderiales bacterium]|nr:hypothetical protein [Burkholderiales bacterium]
MNTPHAHGHGALLLLFDVVAGAVGEHDDWHTREHLPERLSIPGFIRGTRWTRDTGSPRYCVIYDVADPGVLESPAYRERLDHPTPWTARMMTSYVGMRRTLCEVVAAAGEGIGAASLVVPHAAAAGRMDDLRRWLVHDALPAVAACRGVASWRLYANAREAAMTREQAIRGRDGSVAAALVVTGYDDAAISALASGALAPERWAAHGAAGVEPAVYRLACTIQAP